MKVKQITLTEAQSIYGDDEAIERGYITENLMQVAQEMALELLANGGIARDGMCLFPVNEHVTEKYMDRLNRKEQQALDCIGAYFMGSVVEW